MTAETSGGMHATAGIPGFMQRQKFNTLAERPT